MINALPAGFNSITAANLHGSAIAPFGFKVTPVTNGEWASFAQGLGQDRFVLLHHDWNTGETRLEKKGQTVEEVLGGPAQISEEILFDQGDIMIFGSMILLKIADNPSAQHDEPKKGWLFSGENQPVVGVTYFHAKAWCLLKTLESNGQFQYDLPTDAQYEYVASDRGTKEYGTENGTLWKGKKKLAHIDEYKKGKETTVAVDDSRYEQELPFGVQTTGNVWRWTRFNSEFKRPNNYFSDSYGLRGGSWIDTPDSGRAAIRNDHSPDDPSFNVGFSPVVMRQDSL